MTGWIRALTGFAAGAAAGYLMYRFVGCRTGACPLTGSPWLSPLIWGVLGALLAWGRI